MENSLPFTNIREVWPAVRAGLENLKQKCPGVRWLPEDVYAECVNGSASLCYENGRFIILKFYEDELTGAKVIWVWIAYGEGINGEQERLDAYAKTHGYNELRLTSSRPGWARTEGWEFMEATYRRKL